MDQEWNIPPASVLLTFFCTLGKSTIAALIERFYDVQGGEVIIDGLNIKELDPSWVRGELIGYINQVRSFEGGRAF